MAKMYKNEMFGQKDGQPFEILASKSAQKALEKMARSIGYKNDFSSTESRNLMFLYDPDLYAGLANSADFEETKPSSSRLFDKVSFVEIVGNDESGVGFNKVRNILEAVLGLNNQKKN